jgi:pimeloyl-ACP methyl ester carboxylesterase
MMSLAHLRVLLKSIRCLLLFLLAAPTLYGQDGFVEGAPAIAYWEVGKGKETVIVLHGGPAAAHDYLLPEWNALSKEAKVVYYDQRGCGKSAKASCYSWREHVADLKRVIGQLAKGKKVVLAGSSWGAALALLYTYTHPDDVKGLILSGTYNWIGKGGPEKHCADYLAAVPFGLPRKDTFYYTPVTIAHTTKHLGMHSLSNAMTINSMTDAPTLPQLAAISQPVLVFKSAGNCKDAPVKEGAHLYESALPNIYVYTITGACHDPWLSHREEFFAKANAFLKRLK